MIKVSLVDQYPYLEYTILLDKCILVRLGHLHSLLHIHKNTIMRTPISFWHRCRGKFLFHRGVYDNINTKYFFITSDICFDFIFDTLFFLCFVKNLHVR